MKVCYNSWNSHHYHNLTSFKTDYNVLYPLYFPTGYFVQNYFPYSSSHGMHLNYIGPFARTNYLYSSFVPSVISLWNNLHDSVKTSSISVFKAH